MPDSLETMPGRAEGYWHAIADASNDAIFIHDLKAGELVDVNRRAVEMYGFARENFIGSGIARISSGVPPYTDREALRWVLKVRAGKPQIIEWQAQHADGHLFPVEVSVRSEVIDGRHMVIACVRDISDRKVSELQLRESEERLRLVLEATNQGLYDLNAQTGECIVSPEYATMLGYDPATFLETNDTWFQRVHPDDIERVGNRYQDYVNGKSNEYRAEFRLRRADGDWIWVLSLGSIVEYDGEGKPLRMLGTHKDITKRRQADALAQATLDALSAHIVILDQEGRIIAVNRSWEAFAVQQGAPPGTCSAGGNYLDACASATEEDAEDAARFAEGLRAVLAGERDSFEMEYPCETKEQRLWFSARITAFPGEDDPRVAVAHENITTRKNAELALQESQSRFSSLLANLPGTVYRCKNDEQWSMDFISSGIQTLCGHSPEELLGNQTLSFADLIHPDDRLRVTALIQEKIAKHEMYDFEYRIVTKQGLGKWVWERGSGVFDGDRLRYLEGVIYDVTERKWTEKKLHQRNEELQRFSWLLEKEADNTVEATASEYGDITALNQNGLILNSVGKPMLETVSDDIMDLLDTCVAVYEKNGNYAFGTFISAWCGTMDNASRRRCKTDDNAEALNCGNWLCHDSCWRISKEAIESGEPVDRTCAGGMDIYAVPIRSGDEIIGVINFGYGTPPMNANKLEELSRQFHVDQDTLLQNATAYKPRPPFIIEVAKRRLQSSARLIGEIVSRKRIEETAVARNSELVRFNKAAVGRELRMVELKKEINALCRRLEMDAAYPLHSNHEE